MDRRAFIGGIALEILARARATRAQPSRKIYKIGLLYQYETTDLVGPQPRNPSVNALLERLRELGYVYGEHFVTEPRGAAGRPERFTDLAAELVRLQVDVIVAAGPFLPALKQTTSTIPVVLTGFGDALGEVQSLGRPGGNITGPSLQFLALTEKRLELLKELVPGAAPVAVLWDPRPGRRFFQTAESAARQRGWKLLSLEIRDASEIEGAFKAATRARAGALFVFPGGLLDPHARRIAELATKSRLPAIYAFRFYVEAGGLISYGTDVVANGRRVADYVDKILRGAKPADLPVEQQTKFELVINLKAAQAIGLTLPPSILLRADEVIQ